MADYTFLWRRATLDEHVGDELHHAAGEQLKKLEKNDRLWIVGSYGKRLFLAGSHLVTHSRLSQRAAEQRMGGKCWKAKYHVLLDKRKAKVMELKDITNCGHRLRFEGPIAKLPADPANWAMALRQLRTLAPQCARLLHKVLGSNSAPQVSSKGKASTRTVGTPVRKALEGRLVENRHFASSRNAGLRRNALDLAEGKCAACDRDFSNYLKHLGLGVLEVHHKKPLASHKSAEVTFLSDLVVLCSNCHALVHANRTPPLAVAKLRKMIGSWERRGGRKHAGR